MPDNNKVYFGFSNVHYAILTGVDGVTGKPTYGVPIPMPGAVDFAPNPESSEYKFYADNQVFYSTYSDNGYTGDLEMAKFPEQFLVDTLGYIIDAVGGLIEVANGEKKQFALLGQIEGDKSGRRFVYYNCTNGKASSSMHTNEDGIEVQNQTMPVTCAPIEIAEGVVATKYAIAKDATSAAVYDAFFAGVYIPTIPAGV
ncbi:MAG TPA: major tail protein [Patescibacteria group bacterium]|nr:major tail protein [Patescibacteria group bacterium]